MQNLELSDYVKSTFLLLQQSWDDIENSDEYRTWEQFDVPSTIEFDEVPENWLNFTSDPKDIRKLIFAFETALINVYELILYHKLQRKGIKCAGSDLLMISVGDYARRIDELLEFISMEAKIASSFHWFLNYSAFPEFNKFWLNHQNLIAAISADDPDGLDLNLFSNLYLECFPLKIRKFLGEEYTHPDIVKFIIDNVGYTPTKDLLNQRLLDPAVGMGIFIIHALRNLFDASKGMSGKEFLTQFRSSPLVGMEFKLFSAKASNLNFYLHYFTYADRLPDFPYDEHVPQVIHQGNALLKENAVLYNLEPSSPKLAYDGFDYVIGNPPYLRIQYIKPDTLKGYYLDQYQSSEGRFDLSFLFIERGLELLRKGGKLGYITTNKFMSSGAGQAIRSLIERKTKLRLLVDLGDTEFFDAAVLPCIIVLEKERQESNTFPYAIVKKSKSKNSRKAENLFGFINSHINENNLKDCIKIGHVKGDLSVDVKIVQSLTPQFNGDTWHFLTPSEEEIIRQLTKNSNTRLKDLAERIMVGIKSTADGVFIKPISEQFINEQGLERELLHPILRGKNIRKWVIEWSPERQYDRYVLYPHEKREGKVRAVDLAQYPETQKYLESHRKQLEGRQYLIDVGREWYEVWVQQDPEYFEKQYKIVTPDFSTHNCFALDTSQYYIGTSALAVILKDQSPTFNYYVLAILNSKLMEFFHKFKASTFIYAGRYRYWTSYMEKYPMLDYRVEASKTPTCTKLAELSKAQTEDGPSEERDQEINALVYELFGLSNRQVEEISFLLQ